MYYISAYDNYMKRHMLHIILIYGYDFDKQIFYVADFFKNSKYAFSTCSFQNIGEGYSTNIKSYLTKAKTGYYPYKYTSFKKLNKGLYFISEF